MELYAVLDQQLSDRELLKNSQRLVDLSLPCYSITKGIVFCFDIMMEMNKINIKNSKIIIIIKMRSHLKKIINIEGMIKGIKRMMRNKAKRIIDKTIITIVVMVNVI